MNAQIEQWRDYLQRHPAIRPDDVDELEAHLRDQIDDLRAAGLTEDEAFLIAVGRIGQVDDVSQEFAREHSERLWKQLVIGPTATTPRTLPVAIGLAVAAAVAVKIPSLFGATAQFYVLNAALLVLPFLAAYFLWQRRASVRTTAAVIGAFAAAAVLVNSYPLVADGDMQILVAIHVPVFLWFVVGLAYVAGHWRDAARRMDFIRFTGEWVVYYTLLALGGGVLMMLAAAGFQAIGIDVQTWLGAWVLPCGAAGAVVIAAWLVESKQNVVENIAPVLTAVFTPLTTLLLAAYCVALIASGDLARADRSLLILADLILVLVLGLVLYALSAREPLRPPGWFDRMQFALIALALVVDALMLFAMSSRIAEFGATPNKVAALGLNLLLLINLGWAAWLSVGFLRGRRSFADCERWQTTYLPVFGAWAAVVVAAFPLVFGWA